jgi:hypothetical protein
MKFTATANYQDADRKDLQIREKQVELDLPSPLSLNARYQLAMKLLGEVDPEIFAFELD